MTLVEQLRDLETTVRNRIQQILVSNNEIFRFLKSEFNDYNEKSEIMFSAFKNKVCLIYTYWYEGEDQTFLRYVFLPELFFKDFEEYVKQYLIQKGAENDSN